MDPLIVAAAISLLVVAVYLSVSRNPLKTCSRCRGKGVLRSWLLPWRARPCHRCGGDGQTGGSKGRRR